MTLTDLLYRRPAMDDAQGVFDLMIRRDLHEFGQPDSDMEDLLHDWERIDLEQDAWLALTPEGVVAGYAAVVPMGDDLHYDIYVDPVWENLSLAQELISRCNRRGVELAELAPDLPHNARSFLARTDQAGVETLLQAGFQLTRYHYQMRIELEAPPPAPTWPDGIATRHVRPGQDERPLHALIQAAFDRPGRRPQAYEDWYESMLREDIFDPELWTLAFNGDELVGASLGFVYTDFGWVRQLAVSESWRRRGLGKALLLETFGPLWERGYPHIGLGVAADNPNAQRLYLSVGMHIARQFNEYEKVIRIN